jgi:hypothetical protein
MKGAHRGEEDSLRGFVITSALLGFTSLMAACGSSSRIGEIGDIGNIGGSGGHATVGTGGAGAGGGYPEAGQDSETLDSRSQEAATPDAVVNADAALEADAPSDADAESDVAPDADSTLDAPPDAHFDPDRVTGRVVDTHGGPLSQILVALGSQSVLTNDSGEFSFPAVAAIYDVTVRSEAVHEINVYQGVTRRDPVLVVNQSSDQQRTASIVGTVVSDLGYFPPKPSQHTMVSAVPASRFWSGQPTFALSMGTYGAYNQVPVAWDGPVGFTATLFAIGWTAGPDAPASYDGFGVKDIDVTDQGVFGNGGDSATAIPIAPVASRDLAVTVGATPAGTTTYVSLSLGDIKLSERLVTGATTFRVPTGLPSVPLTLRAWAGTDNNLIYSGWDHLIRDATTDLAFDLATPPLLVSPANAVTGVDRKTVFQWTPFERGIYEVLIGGTGYSVFVYTASTSLTLPDLSVVGAAYLPGVRAEWQVVGVGPAKTIDEYVGTEDILTSTGAQLWAYEGSRSCTLAE